MQRKNHWVLKNFNIYENIPEKEFCAVAPNAVDKKYDKGAQIYSPHESAGFIYVVHEGEVILYHSKDGKRAIFDTLPTGSVFGCFNPARPIPNHFAQATKNTTLCVTPVEEFLKLVARYPELMLRLMEKMAIRINDYEEKIQSGIDTAVEKVHRELARLQNKKQRSIMGRLLPIPLQITHEQLAERTNLNRVTVTRCIQKLKKDGLISVTRNTGVIRLHG